MSDESGETPLTDKHFREGGTHITNFSEQKRAVYAETVQRFGDKRFVVSDNPTHHMSGPGGALHWVGGFPAPDFSPFWRLFEAVSELAAANAEVERLRAALASPREPEQGWKLLKDSTFEERSFPEDSPFENGYYYNECAYCGRSFMGYKRRVMCKVCTAAPKGDE